MTSCLVYIINTLLARTVLFIIYYIRLTFLYTEYMYIFSKNKSFGYIYQY